MQELTDAMLANDMGGAMTIIIVVPIILLIIIFIVLLRCYIVKKQENSKKKKNIYITSMIITVFLFGCCLLSIDDLYAKGENSSWYLTYNTITDKYKDIDYSEAGQNRTYYYVITDGNEEFHITENEYDRYDIGDKMYVLRYSDGSGNNIYSTEEYKYVGNKLKE